jgi:hypothetical protein
MLESATTPIDLTPPPPPPVLPPVPLAQITVVPAEPDPAAPTVFDHIAILLAGVGAVVFAWADHKTGSMLTGVGDVALAVAGFGVLGVKGTLPGLLPLT